MAKVKLAQALEKLGYLACGNTLRYEKYSLKA
jgi:hypothetical protein